MADAILLFFVGFLTGIFTGFFGVGGGFFLTPVLNILGLQIVHAIGTSFFVLIGNALIGAWRHFKHGNVILKLGFFVGLASIGGVEIGKMVVLFLERQSLAGTYIRVTYIVILILVSFYMMTDYYRHNTLENKNRKAKTTEDRKPDKTYFISKIRQFSVIPLPQAQTKSVSLWVLLVTGILIGFISGILGVGGGFISLPFLIGVIGVPTLLAVGTSLIIVLLTSSYGVFIYAAAGHVDLVTGLFILAGSLIGMQMGVLAANVSAEEKIKVLFASLLLCVAVSVFLKQIEMVVLGSYLVVSTACVLCLIILWPLRRKLWFISQKDIK